MNKQQLIEYLLPYAPETPVTIIPQIELDYCDPEFIAPLEVYNVEYHKSFGLIITY